MKEIESAIEYFSGYGSPYDKLIVQVLKEKAERDKMRCMNCWHNYGIDECDINIGIWRPTDFCNKFKTKENVSDKT